MTGFIIPEDQRKAVPELMKLQSFNAAEFVLVMFMAHAKAVSRDSFGPVVNVKAGNVCCQPVEYTRHK